MKKNEKKEKRDDLDFAMRTGLFVFVLTSVVLIILVVCCVYSQNKNNEREGYAIITLDGYTDTIYFTKVDKFDVYYKFYLVDGSEVQCHRHNVVIYYDEDKE